MMYIVIFLLIVIGVMAYGIFNLITINEQLEEAINRFYGRVNTTIKLMRMFDDRQMFEHDDEVGETFKQLKLCTEELYTYVTEIRDGDTTDDQEG